MKRNSTISIDLIRFCALGNGENNDVAGIDQLPYDDRHDFCVDYTFGGIAAELQLTNTLYDRTAQCELALTLVDVTTRCEVALEKINVGISNKECCKNYYVRFPAETSELQAGHTYRLSVSDKHAHQTLATGVFHLFDAATLGHPTEWYDVCDGGIRPAWESNLYKTARTVDNHDYYVRFNLTHRFGAMPPAILPELELRLYYPDGYCVSAQFKEPMCLGLENFDNNSLFVEYLFTTALDINGIFYAELLCMEFPIAGFVFNTNREDERGSWCGDDISPMEEYSPALATKRLDKSLTDSTCGESLLEADDYDELLDRFLESQNEEPANNESDADDSLRQEERTEKGDDRPQPQQHLPQLEDLTGLRHVKEKLMTYERIVMFNRMRSDMGLPTATSPLHAMFLGSPGTGKTTVAKLMGKMLRRAGVLSKGHVVVKERATLLGQYYHSEAEKTLSAIEEAQGGILLIEEAYQLYQPNDPCDPGKFVIETLLTALADTSRRDWMLVLAGYAEEMKKMFEMNPGFKSRIPDSNVYVFDDFTEDELMEIAEKYLSGLQYNLTDDARQALSARLKSDYTRRDRTFGNARHVINMIQTEILPAMAVRVTSSHEADNNSLTDIQAADIPRYVELPPRPTRPRVGFTA